MSEREREAEREMQNLHLPLGSRFAFDRRAREREKDQRLSIHEENLERKRKEGKQIHRDCSSSRDGDDDGRREESQRITGIEDQFEGATEAGGQTDARSRSVRVMHCSERERESE